MIINSTPQNEAIISNVGEIGEFRIRNSAKAFGILSSGLYANKIRAVIRELSCNAVDSHVAAGKRDTPFDVHLPTQLEPWFSVRDYGLGLDHESVTNIYTTYFESTKTTSNELIGGLGLGSKSPFAYTDNFTVTANYNGSKRIYTAFINDAGVPSIAKMSDHDTAEPNGVEVKFSVNDRYDFSKFHNEAAYVFRTFSLRPVVPGFEFSDIKYVEKDIIPGVHYTDGRESTAIMGNVPYPIAMPNAEENLGSLNALLGCGLDMHFAIGEIDFQASREGLSYVPATIAAIKKKLEAVNAVLTTKLATEADAITCLWERQVFLRNKVALKLWKAAVVKYVADTKFPLLTNDGYTREVVLNFEEVKDLEKKYNIKMVAFSKSTYYAATNNVKSRVEYDRTTTAPGVTRVAINVWGITASSDLYFVINDTKAGAGARAKYHWKKSPAPAKPSNTRGGSYTDTVYVLSAADKAKPMNTKAFFAAMHNPPAKQIKLATSLLQIPRAGGGASGPVSILRLEEKGGRNRFGDKVWRDAGDLESFDKKATHYYVPLLGHKAVLNDTTNTDIKTLIDYVQRAQIGIDVKAIYGVRKSDIENVKARKNWVNLEEHLAVALTKISDSFWKRALFSELDSYSFLRYNSDIKGLISPTSDFIKVYEHFEGVIRVSYDAYSLNKLMGIYHPKATLNPMEDMKKKYKSECNAIHIKYPLLKHLPYNAGADIKAIAEYINLIEQKVSI